MLQDRRGWRAFVDGVCSLGNTKASVKSFTHYTVLFGPLSIYKKINAALKMYSSDYSIALP